MIRQWLEDRAIYSGKGHTSCSPALSDCLVDVVLRTSAKAAMYGLILVRMRRLQKARTAHAGSSIRATRPAIARAPGVNIAPQA